MDAFLLDTGILSGLVDPTRPTHTAIRAHVQSLIASPKYVSTISIGELRFGIELAGSENPTLRPVFEGLLARVQAYAEALPVSKHTADEYGQLKAALARALLKKALRKQGRPRWVEEWTDQATSMKLQADENDLWLSAQALERNLVLLTTDSKLERIAQYYPRLRIRVV